MKAGILLIFIIGFSTAIIPHAFACSCVADRGIEDAFYESGNLIFSGKVTNIKEKQRTYLVTLEIEKSWKGIPEGIDQINIMTSQSSASCGYNFEENQSYLVEGYGKWDSTPEVVSCGITTNLAFANPQISYLENNPVPEFIIQSVEFMQDVIYPDELGFYEVEITDKAGNPVELFVTGRVDYEAPWGPSNFSPVGNYDSKKEKFVGELTAPREIAPGIYTLKLDVHGLHFGSVEFSGVKQVDFVIGERPGSMETLFHPSSMDKIRQTRYVRAGEPLELQAQLVSGHYYSPALTNHTASILIYGIDRDNNKSLLEAHQLTSDSDGFITQELILDRDFCKYDIEFQSQYNGFDSIEKIDLRITNTEVFFYDWKDEKIPVTVEGECSIPISMSFDQPSKIMSVKVDTTDAKKHFEIHFPHRLLDGELSVLFNGEIDEEQSKVDKRKDEAIVSVTGNSDTTFVQIIGTTAIPEFETIVFIILVVSIIPTILFRKLFASIDYLNTKSNGFEIKF